MFVIHERFPVEYTRKTVHLNVYEEAIVLSFT